MKNVKFYGLITLVLLSLSFSYVGCGGGSGGGDDDDNNNNGTAPSISSVKLFKIVDDVPIETLSFEIGDMINMSIIAKDPDLDMNTLFISKFLLPNLDTPFDPTTEKILPTQLDSIMEYFFIDPVEIGGPAGNWRTCFWIVDNAGNESNEFCVNMAVYEAADSIDSISSYMAIKYNQGISDFEEDDDALEREMSAEGKLLSGEHATRYIQLFPDHIQDFVNDSIQYVSQLAETRNIDKIAIEQIFENYRDTDLSYMVTYTNTEKGRFFEQNILSMIINELTININDIYDLAILQLEAL